MLFHWDWALEVLPSNPTTATNLFLDTHKALQIISAFVIFLDENFV